MCPIGIVTSFCSSKLLLPWCPCSWADECTEHGKGDVEGFEETPESASKEEIIPLSPEDANEIIKVIEQLQAETDHTSQLASDAIEDLKVSTTTTKKSRRLLG